MSLTECRAETERVCLLSRQRSGTVINTKIISIYIAEDHEMPVMYLSASDTDTQNEGGREAECGEPGSMAVTATVSTT